MAEKVLPYDRNIVGQETGYWCGPASAQVVLNSRGIIMREADLAREIGTTVNGTDYIGLIERVLDRVTPDAQYTSVYTERDPMTAEQKNRLWQHLVPSIDGGYGVVMNWWAPEGNKPRGVRGSVSPRYSRGLTMHYVSAMGYYDGDGNPAERAVWIADSGFQPQGYWISFDQCATLIPPKGYCYANTRATVPLPPPPQTPPVALLSKVMGDAVGLDVYAKYLPFFSQFLRRTKCTNNNRIANATAQLRHESGGFKYFRELWGPTPDQLNYDNMMGNRPGEGRKFLGRGPLQVTGRENYTQLSQWAHAKGYVPQLDYFLVHPEALETPEFGFLGAEWYWEKVSPRMNELADAGDIERTSKLINMPAWVDRTDKRANGIDARIQYYNFARGMDLLPLLAGEGKDDDEMAGWTPELVNRNMVLLENIAGIRRPSASPLRWPGEGPIDTSVGFGRLADGTSHVQLVEKLAVEYGDPEQVGLLLSVAACEGKPEFADRQADAKLAARILTKVSREAKADGWDYVQSWLKAEQQWKDGQ